MCDQRHAARHGIRDANALQPLTDATQCSKDGIIMHEKFARCS